MPIAQALELARKQGLDLVEVAVTASPPVCRVLDYGKYRYAQERKEREQRRSQKTIDIREMRLRPKIGDHDFESKVRVVHRLLGEGDKVRIVVMFRGREVTHADLGIRLLQRVVESLKGIAGIEKQPVLDGRRLTMVLSPLPAHKTEAKDKADTKEKNEVKQTLETKEKVRETQDAKA